MEPFKNIFNKKSVKELSLKLKHLAADDFDQKKFITKVNKNLNALELKDRVRLISCSFNEYLSCSYKKSIKHMIGTLVTEKNKDGVTGFMTWPYLQFVEDNGLDDFKTSFWAMEEMTKRFSAEFAIRPYLKQDDKAVFKILKKWSKDSNVHLRRLASEGIRPNLPWGMKVECINSNLKRNLVILEMLRDDPEEYVRKSVANHLNDISRLDDLLMLKTVKKWNKGNISKERKWVIRHATRTLLKQGHPEALSLHGYDKKLDYKLNELKLNKKAIKEGDKLEISFTLKNNSNTKKKILLEYVIHFLKKDGTYSLKPFRLKDGVIAGKEKIEISKVIHFKKVTTRKHYQGLHKISVQVNGNNGKEVEFKLKV